ncbi:MAG: glutathione S-transferase family protein [Rhodobacteraceae bacterium]|nr:glutathione S-transferase family protein [Paracoccaceae bacterium]
MKLYFAPNSRAVRSAWLLYELGLDFEIEKFNLGDPKMRAPEFLAFSPNGRVPVLIDGDVTLFESPAIAEYLAARYGEGKLAPDAASPEYPTFLQWFHYGEGMIMGPVNNYMVETFFVKPEHRSEVHAKRALKLMGRMVQAIDTHMADREYLAGDFSIADTITGHACIVSERCGVDVSDMPNLTAYTKRLLARPALQKAMAL